jgi:hypothetical protein
VEEESQKDVRAGPGWTRTHADGDIDKDRAVFSSRNYSKNNTVTLSLLFSN